MKSYYYVYKHGDNGPRVRHATLKIAQDEAERLAAKEPGQCFEILQCVGYSSTSKASTFWMDGEEPEILPDYYWMPSVDEVKRQRSELRALQENRQMPVDLDRLVLLLNEAYVFLGMPHKALSPWRIVLDKWQAKVEQETGWNHFAEVKKFKQNV